MDILSDALLYFALRRAIIMCGIIGCAVKPGKAQTILLQGLSNLEYRGYDSAGIATVNDTIELCKRSGRLEDLRSALDGRTLDGSTGIGHTRWSTHGPPTTQNAHPHTDCEGNVAVVHNGIIENYHELRNELLDAGHRFDSDTDTEVIAHLLESSLTEGASCEDAIRSMVDQIEGSYALAIIFEGSDEIYCIRRDSPLVVGIGDAAMFLASDIPAFLEFTDQVGYLEDNEIARISVDGWRVTTLSGQPVDPKVQTVDWSPEATKKDGYEHYMLKEIHDQPRALRQCLRGRLDRFAANPLEEPL